ncbi:integrase [Streptomyces albidoflavus]|uniref:integrase n=1 Tax=Streptomyces albidoflavus TaxID=1886 RepID=UPI003F4EB3D5
MQQGVDLVVSKELLGHAHIGVNAHVRLRLQRQAVDCLNNALNGTEEPPDDPPAAALVR